MEACYACVGTNEHFTSRVIKALTGDIKETVWSCPLSLVLSHRVVFNLVRKPLNVRGPDIWSSPYQDCLRSSFGLYILYQDPHCATVDVKVHWCALKSWQHTTSAGSSCNRHAADSSRLTFLGARMPYACTRHSQYPEGSRAVKATSQHVCHVRTHRP